MEKKFECGDIGMNCDYTVCASTDAEAIRRAGEHIQAFHGMKGFSKEFYQKARAAIHAGSCEAPKDCSGGICRL